MHILNWVSISLSILLSVVSAGHALFRQRTPSAALGWVTACLIFPFMGPLLYFLFGINRVETRARKLEDRRPFSLESPREAIKAAHLAAVSPENMPIPAQFAQIARIAGRVTERPLIGGNQVKILHNGEAAYPEMLNAIGAARKSVYLATYIFDTSPAGKRFINALAQAVGRGVDVRVIIDGVGELYSLTRAGEKLKKAGVRVNRFLPPRLFPPSIYINLRNHRKICLIDGRIGFTGGMNISSRHLAATHKNRRNRIMDVHFRLAGPVVMQLEQAFLEDWAFCSGEQSQPTTLPPDRKGEVMCRVITDGPNEDVNKLSTVMIGAIASARERILIMTPYFIPSLEMASALKTAALSGIPVHIVLPARNNLPFVQWAANNMLEELIYWGVNLYFQPPPFAHSKLFVVDDHYTLVGSANLDPRSLRLNFELNVEIYDRQVAAEISAHILERLSLSTPVTLSALHHRLGIVKLRDTLAWLFSGYL